MTLPADPFSKYFREILQVIITCIIKIRSLHLFSYQLEKGSAEMSTEPVIMCDYLLSHCIKLQSASSLLKRWQAFRAFSLAR